MPFHQACTDAIRVAICNDVSGLYCITCVSSLVFYLSYSVHLGMQTHLIKRAFPLMAFCSCVGNFYAVGSSPIKAMSSEQLYLQKG